MNIGVIRESGASDRRVALTPPVVRHLTERGHTVWVESGAGAGAMFSDDEYTGAGGLIAFSHAEVIRRSELVAKISVPTLQELELCAPGMVLLAFYHMAVADRAVFQRLIEGAITAIGCEIIQAEGRLPVLAPISEIAGQMTIPVAAHLLRSSSGGRGILLGGSPGVPPAHVVIIGAGTAGMRAARTAAATGARVTALDIDPEKLRRLMEQTPGAATCLAERDAIAAVVAAADVVIGAVLVAGARTPHVVTREMVESMKPGSAIIDLAIDQGGCVETSRPTTLAQPTFTYHHVQHYCVPNLTADLGRTTSVVLAQALLPYLLDIGRYGVAGALARSPALASGVYTYAGACVHPRLAEAWQVEHCPLETVLSAAGAR
ncbi:MAG: alanine dehydrogenase [Bryobacterales bacterium]|nr:alanine dehydrogenase [Bryobacterales bacterium]